MEFIFQVLAQLFSPVDEDKVKEQVLDVKKVEVEKEAEVQVEQTEQEEPNLFGVMEFH